MAPKDKSMADGKSAIDKELIRELAKLLDETGLTEIEIERDGLRVRVGRGGAVTHVAAAGSPLPPVASAAAIAVPDRSRQASRRRHLADGRHRLSRRRARRRSRSSTSAARWWPARRC